MHTAWARQGQPSGQMAWALHVTMVPTWFDAVEMPGMVTLCMFLYARHDALVQPMAVEMLSPALATRCQESAAGLSSDFERRQNITLYKSNLMTADVADGMFAAVAEEIRHHVKMCSLQPNIRFWHNQKGGNFHAENANDHR